MEGLASAGNGTAEFVKEGERLQPKVRAVNNCYLVQRESIVTNTGLLSHNSKHAAQRRVPQGLTIAIFSISAYRRTNLVEYTSFYSLQHDDRDNHIRMHPENAGGNRAQ